MGIKINLFTNKSNKKQKNSTGSSKIADIFTEVISKILVYIILLGILISIIWFLNPEFISFLIM